ncbi:MAG: phosphoribosylformylglycinamidine synthase, partial [Flavobacteriaceae bacterium]
MIHFFGAENDKVFVVDSKTPFSTDELEKLEWLFEAPLLDVPSVSGPFLGPHAAMISPWSTNAVEITQNMGIVGIKRIEEFKPKKENTSFDPMLLSQYEELHHDIFKTQVQVEDIKAIEDIEAYNEAEGLALNAEEIDYLNQLSKSLGRSLTDSEVFGFSQVNSEHCRHKIFNGTFIIDGQEKEHSLFQLIKKTAKANPNSIVS